MTADFHTILERYFANSKQGIVRVAVGLSTRVIYMWAVGWGTHAVLLSGAKVIQKYTRSNAGDLKGQDLFLLIIYMQDILRQETDTRPTASPSVCLCVH